MREEQVAEDRTAQGRDDIIAFLNSGSEMAVRIAAHDWSASLGPISSWPESLKTAVGLLVHSPVPIVLLWGGDGVMIYNDAYSVFAGGRHPELLGSKVREGWPEVADFNDNVMKVGLAGGTLAYRDQELTLYRSGKPEQVWMNLDYSPVPGESGRPGGVIAIVAETTAQVQANAALRESEGRLRALNATLEDRVADRTAELAANEARLRAIFETGFQYQGLLTPEGLVLDANAVSLRGIQAGLDEVVGRPFWQTPWFTQTPGMPELVRDAIPQVAGGHSVHQEIHVNLPEGGWRWFDFSMRPIHDGGGRVIAIVPEAKEFTDRRRAEEALLQSQKMEAVGQLTGGIAHDFNNLLAGISGSLELLEKRLAAGRFAGLDRYITAAQGAARRAAALTQRLLAFSRRQTLDPRPIDANRLIAGMEDLIRRVVGPEITVEVVGAGGLWLTKADASQLENSLLNLCLNGRDAMAPNGGRLTIETANRWLDDRTAREQELPPGQYVSLCVTDTGVGMEPEVIARAFDPFFTTKPLGEGTGLGLSMVYGFVRQTGGQVRIYSEVGAGTTMCLYLPRYVGADVAADSPEMLHAGSAGEGETVLVIDDEATIRMVIVEVLEENGYRALEAADGASGLKILQSDVRIDLLVTDVGLPGGLNGRQVADAARLLRPQLKVLFVTGYAENAALGDGRLEAGMEIVTKPFVAANLGDKIRELIDR